MSVGSSLGARELFTSRDIEIGMSRPRHTERSSFF
jgi:hypothetical protein